MFDWDRDHESITTPTAFAAPPEQEQERRTGYFRVLASRWLAPAAVIAGIALAGQSLFQFDLPFRGVQASTGSFGALRAVLFSSDDSVMPDGLVIYGPAQFENFMQGIVRFNDADLMQYAATTARDLGQFGDPMTPYMLDVLLLTHREIDRRGLSRPTASVDLDEQRAAFRQQAQAL